MSASWSLGKKRMLKAKRKKKSWERGKRKVTRTTKNKGKNKRDVRIKIKS